MALKSSRDDYEKWNQIIERISTIVSISDGRDKVCKSIQYIIKLALFINSQRFEKRFGVIALKLKQGRQILRLLRFLRDYKTLRLLLNTEKRNWKGFSSLACCIVGIVGEFIDDVCWLSQNKILPHWVCDYEDWTDYLWLLEIMIELPQNTYKLKVAHDKYAVLSRKGRNSVETYNAMIKVRSIWLTQIKMMADTMHALRLTFNFPTSSKGQDAIFGLLSALVSLYKLWKPLALQPLPITKPHQIQEKNDDSVNATEFSKNIKTTVRQNEVNTECRQRASIVAPSALVVGHFLEDGKS